MTGYILGEIPPNKSDFDTFVPPYSHCYEERVPDIYVELDGRKFDLVRQIFVDGKEKTDGKEIHN